MQSKTIYVPFIVEMVLSDDGDKKTKNEKPATQSKALDYGGRAGGGFGSPVYSASALDEFETRK